MFNCNLKINQLLSRRERAGHVSSNHKYWLTETLSGVHHVLFLLCHDLKAQLNIDLFAVVQFQILGSFMIKLKCVEEHVSTSI